MSLDDYHLIDNETNDKSFIKREFLNKYLRQGANLDNSSRNIEFILGENNNYIQLGNAYLQY